VKALAALMSGNLFEEAFMTRRQVLVNAPVLLAVLLSGCGAHVAPISAARASVTAASGTLGSPNAAGTAQPFDGPAHASAVMAYGNNVVRTIDEKALFVSLIGINIDETGLPQPNGRWELLYIGSNVAAPAGEPVNPYVQYVRRISIVITPDGKARLRSSKQAGLPLGVCFMQSPMPLIDSADVFKVFYDHRAGVERTPIAQMTLAGMVSAHHFNRLIWRIGTPTTTNDAPTVLIDANTGSVLDEDHDAPAPKSL
jgi:hypothetical protein